MVQTTAESRSPESSRRHLAWFLLCRALVISLLLGGTIVYHLRGGAQVGAPLLLGLYLLAGASLLQALVSAALLSRIHRFRLFVQAQIVWDILFATAVIYLTGGIDSPFAFLFILVIISASVFLRRKEIVSVASAAAILYGSLLDLQYYGYLQRTPIGFRALQADSREVFFAVFVNVIAYLLTGLLGGLLTERLRRSEQALRRREIDYEELENLNRTILASIGSGLMSINLKGRIRSFNAAAESITGYTLEEVYDRDVRELFPAFIVYDGTLQLVDRGEGICHFRESGRRILGYASSLIKGADGKLLGLLITFKDMTWLKEMEERLKRADRLAAVGQLASGMAHEIRNPLASISGSVQLLMEGTGVSEEERRLMRIVVKEADRLSNLLSDFLLYAHPGPPKISSFDISAVLDELADIFVSDSRFAALEIRRVYPGGVPMRLDRQLFYQAIWNLAINAAEAMPDGGTLTLGIIPVSHEVFVEDTGPGIPQAIQDQIFNPFFTTKDRGTGLGLATVHKIVEAHGGNVTVASASGRGTRFTIRLPAETAMP